jgi:RNA polymerase sigma factor (sigma-70 family)
MLCSRADAEDATAETFLRVLRRSSELSLEPSFRTSLYKIARNLCLDRIRPSTVQVESTQAAPQNTGEGLRITVERALSELPAEYREPLVLCDLEDLSPRVAADVLKISVSVLTSRLRRAREALRAKLGVTRSQIPAPVETSDLEIVQLAKQMLLPSPGVFLETQKSIERLIQGDSLVSTLTSIDPREFEELVSDILARLGMSVRLTPYRKDNGTDIIATQLTPIGEHCYYVQCKHHSKNPVGVEAVRELYGIVSSDSVTTGLLVASTRFTKPAMEFRNKVPYRVQLADREKLNSWIKELQR